MLKAKFFYNTGSKCTSSLAAVNACLSQSYDANNPYNLSQCYKYEVSGSNDLGKHVTKRMSELCGVKTVPTIIFGYYYTSGSVGMEEVRICGETSKQKFTQTNINAWCAYISSSTTSW